MLVLLFLNTSIGYVHRSLAQREPLLNLFNFNSASANVLFDFFHACLDAFLNKILVNSPNFEQDAIMLDIRWILITFYYFFSESDMRYWLVGGM